MITDHMVEVTARAILDAELWPGSFDKANETERGHVLYKARVALTAVLPMIRAEVLEEAAKVAAYGAQRAYRDFHDRKLAEGAQVMAVEIAAAIRAMKGVTHDA